ncbi:DUF222 domain-containing protein [Aeromicrobium sp. CF3.5]|uniref:HNH endonuclease signature motif containing protein n=1 Tax=Aeromicrobium sp. CF3.5 TaxID=3373078 RepID=UPI003EE752F5
MGKTMAAEVVEPHLVVACTDSLHRVLDDMGTASWDDLDDTTVRSLVADLSRVQARVQAQQLRGAAKLESSGAARKAGKTSTGDLLAGDFGGDRASADAFVRASRQVAPESATQAALAAGDISFPQAQIIGRTLAGVPEQHRQLAEARLLGEARTLSLKDLRRRADRVRDTYAPKDEADAAENETIQERERRARASARFRMWDNRDGTCSGDFKIPEAQADRLKAAVDAIAAPRRAHLADEDARPTDTAHRMGMAFADLCDHLPTDGLPSAGGAGATVTVTLDLAALRGKLRAATLSTGTRVSASQARQLACRARILPAVLGGASLPLDLGRTQRLFSPAQRTALAMRDGGCVFPGCDRPPPWTEAHHITAWSDGGPTDLSDGALLCPFHHHVVHDHGWQLRTSPHDGHVEMRLPGHQHWQRNHRYRPGESPPRA